MKILIALLILAGLGIGVYTYNAQTSKDTNGPSAGDTASSPNTTGLISVDRSNRGLTKFPSDVLSETNTQARTFRTTRSPEQCPPRYAVCKIWRCSI